MSALRLVHFEDGHATFEPAAGRREVMNFVNNPARRDRLAAAMKYHLGRPVGVTIQLPATGSDDASASDAADAPHGATAGAAARSPASTDRRAALDLPLVKDILDIFPDATLVDAGDDSEPDPPPTPRPPERPDDADDSDDSDD